MLTHDDIFEIYDILTSELPENEKYFALANRYAIGDIKVLCNNFMEEPIFAYVAKRIVALEANMVSFLEYEALIRQMRATYRGQLYKEQHEQDNKKTL